jgi:hypothetical protein
MSGCVAGMATISGDSKLTAVVGAVGDGRRSGWWRVSGHDLGPDWLGKGRDRVYLLHLVDPGDTTRPPRLNSQYEEAGPSIPSGGCDSFYLLLCRDTEVLIFMYMLFKISKILFTSSVFEKIIVNFRKFSVVRILC